MPAYELVNYDMVDIEFKWSDDLASLLRYARLYLYQWRIMRIADNVALVESVSLANND